MSSRDTAPSSTFIDNWSGSILCSRNRPTYRCSKYRQHLFCKFSVQKLNHDIVCGTCKAVCDVYVFWHTTYLLCIYYNILLFGIILDSPTQDRSLLGLYRTVCFFTKLFSISRKQWKLNTIQSCRDCSADFATLRRE